MEGGGATALGTLPKTTWLPSDLLGALALARRYWITIIACSLAGLLAMMAAAVVGGPSYTVAAKILVNLGPETAGSPLVGALQRAPAAPALLRPEDSTTGVEIFSNPRLIRQVVENLGEDFFADAPPVTFLQRIKFAAKEITRSAQEALREVFILVGLRPRTTRLDRLTLAIGAALHVEPVRRSDVIDVTLRTPDPRAGEIILGRFIELALADHIRAYRLPGVAEFLNRELIGRRAELRAAEERLLALRLDGRNPVWSVTEQRSVLIRAEDELQQQLRRERASIAATEAEIGKAETALAALPGDIELSRVRSRNTETDALRSRLVQLRLDRASQEARYGADSPEIADIRRQTDALTALLASEPPDRIDQVTTGVNQLHQSLERDILAKRVDLEGQRGRVQQLDEEITRVRAQLRDIETAAIEIAQLELTVARLNSAIEVFQRNYETARVAETMAEVRLSGLRVVMPPTAEIIPSAPSLKKSAALGLIAGLGLALALIVLREYRLAAIRPDDGPDPDRARTVGAA